MVISLHASVRTSTTSTTTEVVAVEVVRGRPGRGGPGGAFNPLELYPSGKWTLCEIHSRKLV